MSATETFSPPMSPEPNCGRNSLPDFHSSEESKTPGLLARNRRSFRRSGRSSDSTSSEHSPFGSAFSRSSLRGASATRGSPSPARKLTTPQGPNLATASRNRQCKCSEMNHHGPHGHVTPVIPRVPLERERATRRSRGAATTEDPSVHGRSPRCSDAGVRRASREARDPSRDGRRSSREATGSRKGSDASQDGRKSSLGGHDALSDSKLSGNQSSLEGWGQEADAEPAKRKGSVTTMVKWVPWLTEKYSTTLTISPSPQPSTPTHQITEDGLHILFPMQPKMKIIHASSTTSSTVQPSFLTSIGAPPAIIARLSMA